MESLCLLLQGLPAMKGLSGSRVAPRFASPAPAAPRASTQRLRFPMRGFRRHFPFVTPAVTRQVLDAVMFRECVVLPWLSACLRRLSAASHCCNVLESDLETADAPTYACIHILGGKRLPLAA